MKKVLFILVIGCLGACKKAEVDKGEVAARVAKQYYDQLIAGNEQAFLDARYQPERIPERYKEQLKENIKMFIAQQKEEHKGIVSAKIIRHEVDTAKHMAHVFLLLSYGDSTKEQIVVPMIEHKGTWLLK